MVCSILLNRYILKRESSGYNIEQKRSIGEVSVVWIGRCDRLTLCKWWVQVLDAQFDVEPLKCPLQSIKLATWSWNMMQQTVGNCVGLYDAHADSLYICVSTAGSKVVCGTHVYPASAATRDCCNIDSTALVEQAQDWRICGTRDALLSLFLLLLPDQRLYNYIVNNICIYRCPTS